MNRSYSSSKLYLLWCPGWFKMYLQTLSTPVFETENAEAYCCHLNRPVTKLFSFINFSELSAIIVANSSSDFEGERETSKWTCSGLAYIAYNFDETTLRRNYTWEHDSILWEFHLLQLRVINNNRWIMVNNPCNIFFYPDAVLFF